MKIIKIEIKENTKELIFDNSKIKLCPVVLTLKTWYGKKTKINAYPSDYGPTYGSESILFYYFFNDLGKEIKEKYSKQINNWFLKRSLDCNSW